MTNSKPYAWRERMTGSDDPMFKYVLPLGNGLELEVARTTRQYSQSPTKYAATLSRTHGTGTDFPWHVNEIWAPDEASACRKALELVTDCFRKTVQDILPIHKALRTAAINQRIPIPWDGAVLEENSQTTLCIRTESGGDALVLSLQVSALNLYMDLNPISADDPIRQFIPDGYLTTKDCGKNRIRLDRTVPEAEPFVKDLFDRFHAVTDEYDKIRRPDG